MRKFDASEVCRYVRMSAHWCELAAHALFKCMFKLKIFYAHLVCITAQICARLKLNLNLRLLNNISLTHCFIVEYFSAPIGATRVEVITGERVIKVNKTDLQTVTEQLIPSTITVWAVGVKAQTFKDQLDRLTLNSRNQIVVNDTLQTEDEHIFALGDCAACPRTKDLFVPPTAQAAHQEAALLAKSLPRLIAHQSLLPFTYYDYGSLISLSRSNTIGSLMGKLMKSILIEGKIARVIYWSLYKKHLAIVHGYGWVLMHSLSNLLTRQKKPRLKLH